MEINLLEKRHLTSQERAYILDKLSNSSFYIEKFGELDSLTEEKLIVSIFLKLQNL